MHGRSWLTEKARRPGPAGMQKTAGQNDGLAEEKEKRGEERAPWHHASIGSGATFGPRPDRLDLPPKR